MRVTIVDLVDQPGASRAVRDAVPIDSFGDDPWGPAEGSLRDPVRLDLRLDSVVDGILVRGTVGFDLELPCARCLEPQATRHDVEVAELFVDPAKVDEEDDDEPGYELLEAATSLDLTTLVRDALLIELPMRILCREDCQGLCPVCGEDRNVSDCGHADGGDSDPRWAALAELELPPD